MKRYLTACFLTLLLFLTASCTVAGPVTEPVNAALESAEPSPASTPAPTLKPSPDSTTTSLSSDLQAVYECALVGCWHAAPGFPAGYAQRYIFYINYKFVFLQNQMDTTSPLISYWGTWKLEEDQLILTVLHKRMVVGGVVVPDELYGEALVEGTVETIDLDPPELLTYPFPGFEIDKTYFSSREGEISYRITIGEYDYWKLDTFDDFDAKKEFYNPSW